MSVREPVRITTLRASWSSRARLLAGLVALAMARIATAATTPEEALRTWLLACQHENLDAAVAARDFDYEARAGLLAERGLKSPDAALVQHTAQVLELDFRKQVKVEGFPDLRESSCAVVGRKTLKADLVRFEQECTRQDGSKSRQQFHAAKSAGGWRVVVLP